MGTYLHPNTLYVQKCKFQRVTQNLRVFAYIARDYESAAEAARLPRGQKKNTIGNYTLKDEVNIQVHPSPQGSIRSVTFIKPFFFFF